FFHGNRREVRQRDLLATVQSYVRDFGVDGSVSKVQSIGKEQHERVSIPAHRRFRTSRRPGQQIKHVLFRNTEEYFAGHQQTIVAVNHVERPEQVQIIQVLHLAAEVDEVVQ